MAWNRTRNHNCPCNGCADRYPACSDHCKKEEFIQWRLRMKEAREAEKQYRMSCDVISDAKKKEIWKKQRRRGYKPCGLYDADR